MAAHLPGAPEAIDSADQSSANTYLAQYGLRVYGRDFKAELAIANKPLAGLCSLFEGTSWADGVWAQAVRRVPGAKPVNLTLARVPSRGYRIPFTSIPGILTAMDDSVAAQHQRAASPHPDDLRDF